jgi:hypothetical protein
MSHDTPLSSEEASRETQELVSLQHSNNISHLKTIPYETALLPLAPLISHSNNSSSSVLFVHLDGTPGEENDGSVITRKARQDEVDEEKEQSWSRMYPLGVPPPRATSLSLDVANVGLDVQTCDRTLPHAVESPILKSLPDLETTTSCDSETPELPPFQLNRQDTATPMLVKENKSSKLISYPYQVNTYKQTYIYTYKHTYKHTYIHTYIHTFIHAYIHT